MNQGHFRLENIPEGQYELTGERAGFLRSEWGAKQPGGSGIALQLKAAYQLKSLVLKLVRGSAINGKIIDENGEPMAKTLVHAVWRDWFRGQPHYFTSEGTWTNDAGEYRIANLPPRRYYLCAESSSEIFVEKQGGPEKQAAWSFYTDTRTLDDAIPLDLQPGQELQGIDLQLHAEPVFHIRGKLAGKNSYGPESGLTLNAHPHRLGDGPWDLDDGGGKGNGKFDFAGAPPGDYDVELLSEEYKQTIARIYVEVKQSDVNGLTIPLPNRFELKGVVHRLDTARTASTQLTLIASDVNSPMMSHPYWAAVHADGSFKIENVWPGKYVFNVSGQERGDYVKSIQAGGREILGVPVELAAGTEPLDITLSGGAGRISGSVQPAASGLQVVLLSKNSRIDYNGIRLARTDQNGYVAFEDLPPGKYYAFAAERESSLFENRNFFEQLQDNGVEIEVQENGDSQVHIPTVPPAEVQRVLSAFGL